jgi:hypothetical protein
MTFTFAFQVDDLKPFPYCSMHPSDSSVSYFRGA